MVSGSSGLWGFDSMYSMLGSVRRRSGGGRVKKSAVTSSVKAMWMWEYQWSPLCLQSCVCAEVRVGGFGFANEVGVSGWCQYVGLSGSFRGVDSLSLVAMRTSNR
jgi:hypothetical protein